MKKMLGIFFLLVIFCIPTVSNALATNSSYTDIRIYFFYEEDCKDCEEARKWLEEQAKEDYRIRVVDYERKEYLELYESLQDAFHIKKDTVPLIIIGSNSFLGFHSKIQNNLTEAIASYEDADDYCDMVSKVQNQEDLAACIQQNQEIYHPNTGLPVFVKVILAICGIGLLVGIGYFVQKKKG